MTFLHFSFFHCPQLPVPEICAFFLKIKINSKSENVKYKYLCDFNFQISYVAFQVCSQQCRWMLKCLFYICMSFIAEFGYWWLPLQLHYKIEEDKKKKKCHCGTGPFAATVAARNVSLEKGKKMWEAINYNKKQSFLPSFILFLIEKGKNLVN